MSLLIYIHPVEIALGARLIAAAAAPVRRPHGKFVAAWDHRHVAPPFFFDEQAVAAMLVEAAQTPDAPNECFCFGDTLSPRAPGAIPALLPWGSFTPQPCFEPAVRALADSVSCDGAFGVVVSFGGATGDGPLPRRGGILRLCPGGGGGWRPDADPFVATGFPTLVVTEGAVPNTRSAHEILELCAALAAATAVGVDAARTESPCHPTPGRIL